MSKVKNIIEELDLFVPAKNKHSIIESRATHIISSAINLAHLIRESYSKEDADDLIKRLFRSMMTEDENKFTRKIREIKSTDRPTKGSKK